MSTPEKKAPSSRREEMYMSNKQFVGIPNQYFAVLSHWASVSRTLVESLRLLDEFKSQMEGVVHNIRPLLITDTTPIEDASRMLDDLNYNMGELESLIPALDAVNAACKEKRLRDKGEK